MDTAPMGRATGFWFTLSILLLSVGYTAMAFQLDFTTPAGQMGPGFFPRLIGSGLVLVCAYSALRDATARHEGQRAASSRHTWDMLAISLATVAFVLVFGAVGPLPAMAVFLLLVLTWFNPREKLANVLLAVFLPIALYLLFYRWLGSPMPQGIFS